MLVTCFSKVSAVSAVTVPDGFAVEAGLAGLAGDGLDSFVGVAFDVALALALVAAAEGFLSTFFSLSSSWMLRFP